MIWFYFNLFSISMPNKSFILFTQKGSGFTTAKCPKKKRSSFWVEFEGKKGQIRGKNEVHLPQVIAIYGHSNTVWQGTNMSWIPFQNLTVPISVPLLFSGLMFTVCRPSSTRKSLVIHAIKLFSLSYLVQSSQQLREARLTVLSLSLSST